MKPISKEEILAFPEWERIRKTLRPLFIHEKDHRRLTVGAHLTFLFENTQTLWYQVEEMIRVERIADPAAIQSEIDTYNELIPAAGELSATLMIEFGDPHERDAALKKLLGLERHVWLRIGERKLAMIFDERQMSPERLSSVQFVRLPIGLDAQAFLAQASAGKVAVVVDHPYLGAEAPITGPLAAALAEDLRITTAEK